MCAYSQMSSSVNVHILVNNWCSARVVPEGNDLAMTSFSLSWNQLQQPAEFVLLHGLIMISDANMLTSSYIEDYYNHALTKPFAWFHGEFVSFWLLLNIGYCRQYLWVYVSLVYGGELFGNSGQVASPLYPSQYPHSADYWWVITVDSGMQINITFQVLDIEISSSGRCTYDHLTVSTSSRVHILY